MSKKIKNVLYEGKPIVSDTDEYASSMSPEAYFSQIKGLKKSITDEELKKTYENCLELAAKYTITGQRSGLKKLAFHLKCIEKEREIVKMGITQFIYRDDVEYYIDHVADDVVKIIELENYEREIPDEIVTVISKVKDKFDQLYIVFTDYTGDTERQVEKARRAKDPILFGTFQDKASLSVIDRFYYIADWVDEYCDLTLDKMVNKLDHMGKRDIVKTISTPTEKEELLKQLDVLLQTNDNIYRVTSTSQHQNPKKFDKFKTTLKSFMNMKKGDENEK